MTAALVSIVGQDVADRLREIAEVETKLAGLQALETELDQALLRVHSGEGAACCPLCAGMLGTRERLLVEELSMKLDEIRVDVRYYRQRLRQLGE